MINKASRLTAVDNLSEGSMKKGILDIQLMNRPRMREGQSEDCTNGSRCHDGIERLIVVNARVLGKPPENPTDLVPI